MVDAWLGVKFETVLPKTAGTVALAIVLLNDPETVSSIVAVFETGFEMGLAIGPHLDPKYLLEAADDLELGLDPMIWQMDLTA